jgi:peptidoglycan/LPS O-acetylase OafA/YrhL
MTRRLISVLNVLSIFSITWLFVSRETCPFPLNRWYQFGLGIALFTLVNRGMVRAIGGELFSATAVIVLVLAYGLVIAPAIPVYAGYTERTLVICIVAFVCSILVLARHDHKLCGNRLFSIFQRVNHGLLHDPRIEPDSGAIPACLPAWRFPEQHASRYSIPAD